MNLEEFEARYKISRKTVLERSIPELRMALKKHEDEYERLYGHKFGEPEAFESPAGWTNQPVE